jgi:hypothetical protein
MAKRIRTQETEDPLPVALKRELTKLKKAITNVGGPEHNAYYELKDAIEKFIKSMESRL